MTFEEIIHPISIQDFFENYYEKKPLHIERNNSSYYHSFINPREIDIHLQLKQTYSPNVKVAKDGKMKSPISFSKELRGVGAYVAKPENLLRDYQNGNTIKYDKLQLTYPPIAQKISNLEKELQLLIRTSLYMTPKNSQGYGLHTDRHDVLALQINGSKTWKLKFADEYLPSTYDNHVAVDWKEEELTTIKLKAGDFFYCPRGLAHKVFTEEESSIHFTIGFKPVYGYEVIANFEKLAYKNDFFKKAIPNPYITEGEKEIYKKEFLKELTHLIEKSSYEELLSLARNEMVEDQLKVESNLFLSEIYTPNLEDEFIISKNWTLEKTKFGCVVFLEDQKYNFPIDLYDSLNRLKLENKIQYKDMNLPLSIENNVKLIKRLIKLKIISVV